jgi:hypothetical protein
MKNLLLGIIAILFSFNGWAECIEGNCVDGQGTYIWEDGEQYSGEWKDDIMHGQGTLNFANGDQYIGEWKDDMMHGQGTYTWANGDQYIGEWKDAEQHGQGTTTYADGTSEDSMIPLSDREKQPYFGINPENIQKITNSTEWFMYNKNKGNDYLACKFESEKGMPPQINLPSNPQDIHLIMYNRRINERSKYYREYLAFCIENKGYLLMTQEEIETYMPEVLLIFSEYTNKPIEELSKLVCSRPEDNFECIL